MKPSSDGSAEAPTVLAIEAGDRGPSSLWWADRVFSIAPSSPAPGATRLASGFPAGSAPAIVARAAVGIQDDDGMLVWVELAPDEHADSLSAGAMDALLERLGCSARIALAGSARAFLGGSLDAAGEAAPAAPPPAAARLVRVPGPDAHPMFADTPLVPSQVWRPLQAKRVRYFYKPAASASASASAPSPHRAGAGAPPASPAPNSATSTTR
jgi:hypothetical protein